VPPVRGSATVTGVLPALGGMLALASALGIERLVYTPILPAMAEAPCLSKTEAGLIQGNRISKQGQDFGEVGIVPCGSLEFASR